MDAPAGTYGVEYRLGVEAWKAAVGLREKLFLVILGALIIPAILQKGTFPAFGIAVGLGVDGLCFILWVILVLRGYGQAGESKDER